MGKQSELDFGVLAEGAKDEYLALAQKARLFYQDPAILNLLKPVEMLHNPFKKMWHGKSRHAGLQYEGKTKFQERPWLIWEWEMDNPDPKRWVPNLVYNYLNYGTNQLVKYLNKPELAFRIQNYGQRVISTLKIADKKNYHKGLIANNMNIDMMMDSVFVQPGHIRPPLTNLPLDEECSDIEPISPFADCKIATKYSAENRSAGVSGATTFVRMAVPDRNPVAPIEAINWDDEACRMLTCLMGHSKQSEDAGNTTVGIVSSGGQWLFCVLDYDVNRGKQFAYVDGPHNLYTRLDNRNWRAGDTYCSDFNSKTIAKMLAYWSL